MRRALAKHEAAYARPLRGYRFRLWKVGRFWGHPPPPPRLTPAAQPHSICGVPDRAPPNDALRAYFGTVATFLRELEWVVALVGAGVPIDAETALA